MIHMNKKIAVTGLLALCVFVLAAIPASAQPITFSVTSLAQTVRTEGQAETAGTVALTFSGGASTTIVAGSSITVAYAGAPVTSAGVVSGRIGGVNCNVSSSAGVASAAGDCGELVGENNGAGGVATPATPPQIVYSASGANVIIQFNVTTSISVGDYLNIQQVRLNIAQVTGALPITTSQTLNATLSGNSPTGNPITFSNSSVAVATLSSSLVASVPSHGTATVTTCAVNATSNPLAAFQVRVAEVYTAAFTSLTDETAFTPGSAGPPVVNPPATNGATVNVVISNVPAGLAIAYVSSTLSPSLTLSGATPATTSFTSGGPANSYTFNFTFTLTSTSTIENIVANFTAGLPSGNAGPLPSSLGAQGLSSPQTIMAQAYLSPIGSTTAIPRFTQLLYPTTPLAVGTVSDCVSNLLFPYHQASNGYDTSYAIANTSLNGVAFSGGATPSGAGTTCKLVLWTTDFAGNATGTQTLTTPAIAAGGVYSFSSASGSSTVPGSTVFNGAAGYVIGVCNFQDAHAYALVTNGNASVVPLGQEYSVGYLGLIILNPTSGRVAAIETLAH
jgi:hypothetical protein